MLLSDLVMEIQLIESVVYRYKGSLDKLLQLVLKRLLSSDADQ